MKRINEHSPVSTYTSLLTALGAIALFSGFILKAAPAGFVVESAADGKTFKLPGAKGKDSDEQFAVKFTELKDKPAAIEQYNLGPDKVALGGYDAVGYLTKNEALKGKREVSAQWRGVTYYFASDENRKAFLEAPEKYSPAYGGWCATAMAKGEKVEIDPANFKVTNGRLFLFYKGLWGNARKDWDKDEAGLTTKADAHWKKIAGE